MSVHQSRRPLEKRVHDNKALQGAYHKGQRARRLGHAIAANPYRDDGRDKGWRRAFRLAWDRGWSDAG